MFCFSKSTRSLPPRNLRFGTYTIQGNNLLVEMGIEFGIGGLPLYGKEMVALWTDAQGVHSARFGDFKGGAVLPLLFTPIPSSMVVRGTFVLMSVEHSCPIFAITLMAQQERTTLGVSINSETLKQIMSPPNAIVTSPLATSILV